MGPDALTPLVAQRRGGGNRAHLADGQAALREPRRAHASIPAFIFFFQMLYPFAWVNRRDHPTGARRPAAACWCAARRLQAAGGIEAIRDALIDDCALARAAEEAGADLARPDRARARSTRPYADFEDIRRMVARSAYAQLRYSPLLLAGTVARHGADLSGAAVLALFGNGLAQALGRRGLGADGDRRSSRPCGSIGCSPLWGPGAARYRARLHGLYPRFRLSACLAGGRKGGTCWKGPRCKPGCRGQVEPK